MSGIKIIFGWISTTDGKLYELGYWLDDLSSTCDVREIKKGDIDERYARYIWWINDNYTIYCPTHIIKRW